MGIDAAAQALPAHILDGPVAQVVKARAAVGFDDFYDAHVDFAWRVARRLGTPAHRLDDVVQDVFVVVHRKLPSLGTDVPPRAWLFRVVQHVVWEHQRRARRDGFDPLSEDLPDHGDDPERSLVRSEAVALVDRAVRALPEERRDVFILAECEQMTAPEIAAALQLNLNTVYTRIRLARADFDAALARLRRSER